MLLHCLLRASLLGDFLSLLLTDAQVRLLVGVLNREQHCGGMTSLARMPSDTVLMNIMPACAASFTDLDKPFSADARNVLVIRGSLVGEVAVGLTA